MIPPAETLSAAARRILGPARPVASPPGGFSDGPAGPSPLRRAPLPEGYADTWEDVARARALSILNDPAQHHALYGRQQGRAVLARITGDIRRVVMISPSHLKQCGIGEYGRYLAGELARQVDRIDVVRTTSAALALGREGLEGTLVIVNHGPGLFDGLNPRLSQGESTTRLLQNLEVMRREMGALPLIIHHSLLDTDHDLLFSRQGQIWQSDIPSIAFISSAGRQFFLPTLELGVSPVPVPEHTYVGDRDERPEVLGFFGFFQYGGKDFDSLFHLAQEIRGRLVGSVATGNTDELTRFEEVLEDLGVPHDFGSGWVTDVELLERLKEADYFYLPQKDYDHWNNSATARFVANLDRPLFLPPHHPFLDMDDGAIFASKEDLPRLVAHFREGVHYDQAVARVRAFRERAAMARTASAIRTALPAQQEAVGRVLFETPSVCSAERCLELSQAEQSLFCAALGADPARPESFPALFRAAQGRQFWRKHYELGDLIHTSLLESVHAIYLALAKRPVRFDELMRLLAPEGPPWQPGQVLSAAIHQALEDKAEPFHDPEILLLENGAVTDWRAQIAPERIEAFLDAKTARRARILQAAGQGAHPAVSNLAELLLIPADALADRPAPIDLSALDLHAVQAVRRPADRLARLVAAADAAGLRLGEAMVFDHLLPPEVEPRVRAYVLEDFLYYEGDHFLLNAIRRIDKRDPFGIEMVVLSGMMASLGRGAVLAHLLHRAEGRITVGGFDPDTPENRNFEAEAQAVRRFMDAARDPLSGLIEARNTYEVARRNNARWWLRAKTESDALWQAAKGEAGVLTLLYAYLGETAADRGDPARRRLDPVWRIDAQGRFLPPVADPDAGLVLAPGRRQAITPDLAGAMAGAARGFHAPEVPGAWTDGPEGRLQLVLPDGLPPGARLHLELGAFGTAALGQQRRLTLVLRDADELALPLLGEDGPPPLAELQFTLGRDQVTGFDMPLPEGAGGACVLHLALDRAASPSELGVSDDARKLGVLLRALELVAPKTDSEAEGEPEDTPQNPSVAAE
ncbi:hypothetical protein [Sagittula salina]|uniref:Uncharacterized protein n=1 Tax=Sagittula salina TaxID=2820268 RepID=A0A940MMA5_9RHOB|nr:hypothetical protein [Sagittula salina]MBP0484480.1 hypothetical protein [Sagittula salina]